MKKVFLAMAMLAVLQFAAQAAPLYFWDFSSGLDCTASMDLQDTTTKFHMSGPTAAEVNIGLFDLGGGDNCLKMWNNGTASWNTLNYYMARADAKVNWYISRGANLRVTFKIWHDPFDATATNAAFIAGWRNYPHGIFYANDGVQINPQGSGISQYGSPYIMACDGGANWGGTDLAVSPLMTGFNNHWPWRVSKASAIMVRLQAGLSQGGKELYSFDGGYSWTLDADSSANPDADATGNYYVAFGLAPGYNPASMTPVYIDDIIIENDSNLYDGYATIPVELSSFSID